MNTLADFLFWLLYPKRDADIFIGGRDDPYMKRWYVIPRNRFFNIYLHKFERSDDDRALHDHPWKSVSFILKGVYAEHFAGGVIRGAGKGDWIFREATHTHRISVIPNVDVWTLFITGPKVRDWGFLCPQGWVHWKKFTSPTDSSLVGRGCEEEAEGIFL